jgi:hypothetical protein
MSSRILPPELVDSIIDHLHDDPATLHSCALVSSAWLPASRYHIFRRVSIRLNPHDTSHASGKANSLYRIAVSSPHIAPYIRHLVIYMGDRTVVPYGMTQEKSLPLLFPLLANLRRLEFEPSGQLRRPSPWYEGLIDSICTASCLPSIVELRLCGTYFDSSAQLLRMFRLFPALKVLQLKNIRLVDTERVQDPYIDYRYEEEEGGNALITAQRTRLDVLILSLSNSHTITEVLFHPQSFIDVTSICRLNLVVHSPLWAKLLRSTPHLEHLGINFYHCESFICLPCDIF